MTKGGEISPPFFIKVVENRGRALLSDRYDDGNMKGIAVNLSRHLLAATVATAALLCAGVASAQEAKPAKPLDVKNQFRNICGFCHEDYGRHAGKGPKLMDSERTDEYLANRIKNGLPGRMAAFGSVYNDEQIKAFVKFIRSLKAGEEPQNPS